MLWTSITYLETEVLETGENMMHLRRFMAVALILASSASWSKGSESAPGPRAGAIIPDDFPRFIVPGHEREMTTLRELYWLHYQPGGPLITLWDEWMPMSTLWPAMGQGPQLDAMRRRWARALAGRAINAEGYVHTHQHDGPAHAEGWPFPLWTQAGGIGWHFAPVGVPGYDATLVRADGWKLSGARGEPISGQGWPVELTAPRAAVESPQFAVAARVAPWLRLNWRAIGLDRANCYVEWTTQEKPDFGAERRMYFSPASPDETRTMIPVHRMPGWKGTITGLRIAFDNGAPAQRDHQVVSHRLRFAAQHQ